MCFSISSRGHVKRRTEEVVEDALGAEHERPKEDRRLADGYERHEVHALVLRLLLRRS
jgi:hypothetical protein